jgi:glycosyltransferase involved in cell wall biosynthesis
MTIEQAIRYEYDQWQVLTHAARGRRLNVQRAAYERAAACCALTGWAARSITDDYGVPAEKVTAIGVGSNHAPACQDRDWSQPRFLFVGSDWTRKNGLAVLNAFREVRQQLPSAGLAVVGGHPDISQAGVETYGPLRPDRPSERCQMDDLFARATCFVMPSHVEPAGIVYAEALAAGVPAIGTTVGGAGDVIGDAGTLVDPDDNDALLSAMLSMADPNTAYEFGQRAQGRAEYFTWPAVANRLLQVLARISPAFASVAERAAFAEPATTTPR